MKIALTENEIKDLVKIREKHLTYEQSLDLLMKIIESTNATKGALIDKAIWNVRCAYLIGFRDALEAYNNAVKAKED